MKKCGKNWIKVKKLRKSNSRKLKKNKTIQAESKFLLIKNKVEQGLLKENSILSDTKKSGFLPILNEFEYKNALNYCGNDQDECLSDNVAEPNPPDTILYFEEFEQIE